MQENVMLLHKEGSFDISICQCFNEMMLHLNHILEIAFQD